MFSDYEVSFHLHMTSKLYSLETELWNLTNFNLTWFLQSNTEERIKWLKLISLIRYWLSSKKIKFWKGIISKWSRGYSQVISMMSSLLSFEMKKWVCNACLSINHSEITLFECCSLQSKIYHFNMKRCETKLHIHMWLRTKSWF